MSWGLVDIFEPGETARAAELDRQNAELNRRREAMGSQTREQSAAQESRFNTDFEAYNEQILSGAIQGAQEGLAATADTVRKGLAVPINFAWRAIPWQLWAVGAVALFIYAGGGVWLRGILAKQQ
jgi:hypothetical protein